MHEVIGSANPLRSSLSSCTSHTSLSSNPLRHLLIRPPILPSLSQSNTIMSRQKLEQVRSMMGACLTIGLMEPGMAVGLPSPGMK